MSLDVKKPETSSASSLQETSGDGKSKGKNEGEVESAAAGAGEGEGELTMTMPPLSRFSWLIYVYAFVLVVLVVVLVLLALIVGNDNMVSLNGIFIPFDVDQICAALPPGSTCFGPNSATPYYRALFPALGDNVRGFTQGTTQQRLARLVGAHTLTLKDGLIVWGKRPKNQIYFSFTAYVYDVPFDGPKSQEGRFTTWASAGDSITIDTQTPGLTPYVAFIFSANPNVVSSIMSAFLKNWDSLQFPIAFHTTLLPQYLYNPTYRYQVLARLNPRDPTAPIPSFSCRWYTDKTAVQGATRQGIPFLPRGEAPNELKLVASLEEWNAKCLAKVMETYTVIQYGWNRYPFLIQYFPVEGLNWGWQCVEGTVGCQADTRSTIYYTSWGIKVNKDQAVVVVALDHVMTGTALAYCNVNFYDQTTEASWCSVSTGIGGQDKGSIPPLPLDDGMRVIYAEVPDQYYDDTGMATVANSERCYISKTGVGPSYRIILPAFSCIVARPGSTAPVPTQPLIVSEEQGRPPETYGIPSAKNNFGLNAVFSS